MVSLIDVLSEEEREALGLRFDEALKAERDAQAREKAQRKAQEAARFAERKQRVHATGPMRSKFVSCQDFALIIKAQQRARR